MSGKPYTEELDVAAVKQLVHRGNPAAEVAERLGVIIHSMYVWTKRYCVFLTTFEIFYEPKRRHGFNDKLPPAEFELRYFERLAGVYRLVAIQFCT